MESCQRHVISANALILSMFQERRERRSFSWIFHRSWSSTAGHPAILQEINMILNVSVGLRLRQHFSSSSRKQRDNPSNSSLKKILKYVLQLVINGFPNLIVRLTYEESNNKFLRSQDRSQRVCLESARGSSWPLTVWPGDAAPPPPPGVRFTNPILLKKENKTDLLLLKHWPKECCSSTLIKHKKKTFKDCKHFWTSNTFGDHMRRGRRG